MDLAKTTDADGLAEVDVTSYRGSADVEPIDRLRGELFSIGGFDGVNPTWDGKLSLSLQEGRVCLDEFVRLQSISESAYSVIRSHFDSLSPAQYSLHRGVNLAHRRH